MLRIPANGWSFLRAPCVTASLSSPFHSKTLQSSWSCLWNKGGHKLSPQAEARNKTVEGQREEEGQTNYRMRMNRATKHIIASHGTTTMLVTLLSQAPLNSKLTKALQAAFFAASCCTVPSTTKKGFFVQLSHAFLSLLWTVKFHRTRFALIELGSSQGLTHWGSVQKTASFIPFS